MGNLLTLGKFFVKFSTPRKKGVYMEKSTSRSFKYIFGYQSGMGNLLTLGKFFFKFSIPRKKGVYVEKFPN